MKLQGYQDSYFTNLSGGMDSLSSPSNIDDNTWVSLDNFTGEGKKLISMNGNKEISTLNQLQPIVGITSYNEDIFYVQNGRLYSINPSDDSRFAQVTLTSATSSRYNMTTFFNGFIYVVICDSFALEDVRVYRYIKTGLTWSFEAHTISGLTDGAKYKVARYYQGRLILGGRNDNTSLINYCKVKSALDIASAPNTWIDFSTYNGGMQIIGDGMSPIIGFAIRQDVFYIFCRNAVYKIVSYLDDVKYDNNTPIPNVLSATFSYKIDKETGSGAIGQYAICEKEQDIFYFDGKNIRRLSYEMGNGGDSSSVKDVKMSGNMDGYIEGLSSIQTNAVMVFDYPYLYTFVKTDENTQGVENDTAIVYNVKSGAWSYARGYEVGVGCSFFYKTQRGVIGKTLGGNALEILNEKLGTMNATALSKEFTLFDDVDFKRYVQLEVEGIISNGLTVYVDLMVDDSVIQTREINSTNLYLDTTGTVVAGAMQSGGNGESISSYESFEERFEMFNDGRKFQFRIRKPIDGHFELHSYAIRWKAVKAYPMHY